MDSDILRAIQIIDEKIASLHEARNRLAQAFGLGASISAAAGNKAATPEQFPAPRVAEGRSEGQGGPRGRKEELAEFLLQHGPTSRADLLLKGNMPEGTLAYCLNDKRFFVQLDSGLWDITDFSRRGLALRNSPERTEAR